MLRAVLSVVTWPFLTRSNKFGLDSRIYKALSMGGFMDQRNRNDRRGTTGRRAFPFNDSDGVWVSKERRILPDRRMNGIDEAEWSEMPEPSENCQTRKSQITILFTGLQCQLTTRDGANSRIIQTAGDGLFLNNQFYISVMDSIFMYFQPPVCRRPTMWSKAV